MLRIFLLLFIVLSLILFVVPEEKLGEYDSKLITAKNLIRDLAIKIKDIFTGIIEGEDPKDLIKEGIKDKKINIEVGIE